VTWRRTDGGDWTTGIDGIQIRGDKIGVEAILRRLRGLRAAEFVPAAEVPVIQPFDAPARSVDVTMDDGRTQSVTIGRRLDANVYARSRLAEDVDERVVLTDTTALVVFDQSVGDLRDRRLLHFERGRVAKVELVSPNVRVTLIRTGEHWGFPNPALGRVDRRRVNRMFESLESLEFDRVVQEQPAGTESYGLSKPDLGLTMFDEAGSQIDRLVGTRNPGEPAVYLATSGYADVVAEVGADAVTALIAAFEDLRQP
jgi:hypothetical protein